MPKTYVKSWSREGPYGRLTQLTVTDDHVVEFWTKADEPVPVLEPEPMSAREPAPEPQPASEPASAPAPMPATASAPAAPRTPIETTATAVGLIAGLTKKDVKM